MQTRKITAILLGILAWQFLLAQPSHASFLHYTTDNGLSNDNITAIVKDKLGFLWVGTVNGLNRFDGRNFKVFRHDPKNDNTIPNNYILGVALAPDGWIWVSTDSGLCKLDPLWLDIEHIPMRENADTLKNDAVTPVVFDSKGMAWTTGQFGIYQINPKTDEESFFFKTAQNVIGYFSTIIDEADQLWLVNSGLRRFDTVTKTLKEFKGVNPREPFQEAASISVTQDFLGQIWSGTWFSGVWRFVPELDEFVKVPISSTLAKELLPDTLPSGRPFFWVGGGAYGLACFYPDTKEFVEFSPDYRDPHRHNNYLVNRFFKDPTSDNLWIGTEIGLEQYAPASVRFGRAMIPMTTDMGLFSLVCGAVQDNTDPTGQRFFVGVWGTGLFEWNKATGTIVRMNSGASKFSRDGLFGLFQDSRGDVWGCLKGIIGRYNPRTGKWRDYSSFFKDNDKNNVVWSGLEDRKGNLWFVTSKEGLYRYNAKTDQMEQAFFSEAYLNEAKVLNIVQLSEDSQGRLWLAAYRSSLIRYNPATGEAKRFTYPGQKTPAACGAVVAAKSGRVYAAFHETFLELDSDGKLLRRFTMDNGLKTSRVSYIVEDKKGKIWFNSEYLLHCFDPANGKFSYYGKSDGLFSNTMTDALSITPAGEIFVGFQNAFNFFSPDRLLLNKQPPPVAVTAIRVMNKERELRTRTVMNLNFGLNSSLFKGLERDTFLTLNPGEDFFEVEFAALNFNQPERNQYAYMLESFNKEGVHRPASCHVYQPQRR
ncbi:MAG: hypothetical protein K9J37_06820 [Saprospiraceae bacterium]|nr:hypothetical protein [Saprospiraceae bacterium]MCF8249607.1 hypothetical protein [Saprospiraceae bacterium]MCF8280507.1 hypothetical protein [Bacteroidales bacterium]MCF8310439.1 hypothetical protein [Saprospiraceae bacterium]MCF8439817.1 hypothetical protein [Saprospiraceae bacterium]